MDEILLTPDECAEYLRVCKRHFTERIAVLPGFPAPIRIPTLTGGLGNSRYKKDEFISWVENQKVAA